MMFYLHLNKGNASCSLGTHFKKIPCYFPCSQGKSSLSRVDLCRSTFEGCDFTCALMHGTILTRKQRASLALSSRQKTETAWTDDEEEEPDGG
jgi:hypothetical protein